MTNEAFIYRIVLVSLFSLLIENWSPLLILFLILAPYCVQSHKRLIVHFHQTFLSFGIHNFFNH